MKYVMMTLLAGAMLFTFFAGCKDSALLTDSASSTAQLSSSSDEYQTLLRTKDGDGPWVEKWLTPVKWDGKSPLTPGVLRHWDSFDEALNAYKDRNPEQYKVLKDIVDQLITTNSNLDGKTKSSEGNTSLAWAGSVDAYVTVSYGWVTAHAETYSPSNPPTPPTHYLVTASPIDQDMDEYWDTYYDSIPHYNEIHNMRQCPADRNATCHVDAMPTGYWWDQAVNGCD